MKTLKTVTLKPRNPFVVPGLQRVAGAHRRGPATQRQCAARQLRDELKNLHPPAAEQRARRKRS